MVTSKSERRAAREAVAAITKRSWRYWLSRSAQPFDRFRRGELYAFGVDEVLFQYARAAKELWKFAASATPSGSRVSCEIASRSIGGSAAAHGRDDLEPRLERRRHRG